MKALFVSVAFGVGALLSLGAHADAPAGSTALCKDGSYYSGKSKRGACSGHDGIKDWYGAKDAPAAAPKPAPTPAATTTPATTTTSTAATDTATPTKKKHKKKEPADTAATTTTAATSPAAAPVVTPKPATTTTMPAATTTSAATPKHEAPTPAKDIVQKPGAAPGLVWVNSSSKVYHCEGDQWYGKTKEGSYMSEAAAKAAGAHGSGNKDCSK
jgi:hypothetical protein